MNDLGIKETWYAEYSKSQGCYHVESFLERIAYLMRCDEIGHKTDYEVIGEFQTQSDAIKFCHSLKRA